MHHRELPVFWNGRQTLMPEHIPSNSRVSESATSLVTFQTESHMPHARITIDKTCLTSLSNLYHSQRSPPLSCPNRNEFEFFSLPLTSIHPIGYLAQLTGAEIVIGGISLDCMEWSPSHILHSRRADDRRIRRLLWSCKAHELPPGVEAEVA
jgi:hypothetical protein